jgi:hypothetical protein
MFWIICVPQLSIHQPPLSITMDKGDNTWVLQNWYLFA